MALTEEHKRLSVSEWRQRQDADRDARRQEMDKRRDSAREEHKKAADEQRAEVEAREEETAETLDAGYEETMPGQIEIVAGTTEHVQVLNSFPNATSYGPDHNVVVPEPEAPPEEPLPESGGDPSLEGQAHSPQHQEQMEQDRMRQEEEEGGR